MALTPGTRLGPYEVVAAIGAGGMGEVYRAQDSRLDRSVAIKVLPQHLSSQPDLRERFEREARTVSALNHPNICVLYEDVGNSSGCRIVGWGAGGGGGGTERCRSVTYDVNLPGGAADLRLKVPDAPGGTED
jgi:hypothetical protein